MPYTTESYAGYDCVRLENERLALWVTRDVGPRIIGLRPAAGGNLLAVVPDMFHTTPGGLIYRFRGGHRLWYAPEDAERTYIPDDTAVAISQVPNGVQTTQAEAPTGLVKQMTIVLPDDAARVVIDHTLSNHGPGPLELAPWAITQFKPGGFAILPQASNDTGLLPNRRLALWPYTRINSARLALGDRFIFVHAGRQSEKFKLGWANQAGWLGYWIDDTLFIKEATSPPDGDYYDFGSSSECYCDERVLELETLGPRITLAPGDLVTHREVWHLFSNVSLVAEETAVTNVLTRLGIMPS